MAKLSRGVCDILYNAHVTKLQWKSCELDESVIII